MNLEFNFSVFADSVEKQCNKQGYTLGDKAEQYEEIIKAINMVGFYVASPSQVESMIKKFLKMMQGVIIPLKGE